MPTETREPVVQWSLVKGSSWDVIEGLDSGQTHVDHPGDSDVAIWSHPIDIHLACKVTPPELPRCQPLPCTVNTACFDLFGDVGWSNAS